MPFNKSGWFSPSKLDITWEGNQGVPGVAAPAVRQQLAQSQKTTTVNLTWPSTPTAGSRLVVGVGSEATWTGVPAGWTLSTQMSQVNVMAGYFIWKEAAGSAADNLSITFAATNPASSICMAEVTGIPSGAVLASAGSTLSGGSIHFLQNTNTFAPSSGLTVEITCFTGQATTLAANLGANNYLQNGLGNVNTTNNTSGNFGAAQWTQLAFRSYAAGGGTQPAAAAFVPTNPGGIAFSDAAVMTLAFRCLAVSAAPLFTAAKALTSATTGAVLRAVTNTISGDFVMSTASAQLKDTHVTGALKINAQNLLIENCVIDQGLYYEGANDISGCTIRYCEITGGGGASRNGMVIDGPIAAGMGNPVTIDHCYLHCATPNTSFNMEDGVHLGSGGYVYTNNLVNGLFSNFGTPHYDCFQIGACNGLIMSGNHHFNNQFDTSGLAIMQAAGGALANITISNNWAAGGPQTLIFQLGGGSQSGNSMTGNGFSIPTSSGSYLDQTDSGGFVMDQLTNQFFVGVNV
jgi:hypothetical protein